MPRTLIWQHNVGHQAAPTVRILLVRQLTRFALDPQKQATMGRCITSGGGGVDEPCRCLCSHLRSCIRGGALNRHKSTAQGVDDIGSEGQRVTPVPAACPTHTILLSPTGTPCQCAHNTTPHRATRNTSKRRTTIQACATHGTAGTTGTTGTPDTWTDTETTRH